MAVFTRCNHLRINGARCTMPAVYGKDLCYEHESRLQRMRMKPTLPSTYVTDPLVRFVYPEDHDAILENVHSIARALGHNQIDYRTASVMDRLMNTALRTLRQGQKLEKTITSDEMIHHFRLDSDGNPRAIDSEPETQSVETAAEAPEPATIPTITAQAEEHAQPELHRQSLSTPLPTLAERRKLESLLSNTYIFLDGKLIVAPASNRIGVDASDCRTAANVFMENMR